MLESSDTAGARHGLSYVIQPSLTDPGRQAITCQICNLTSSLPSDVQDKYCAHCHIFHEGLSTFEVIMRLRAELSEVRRRNDRQSDLIKANTGIVLTLQTEVARQRGALNREPMPTYRIETTDAGESRHGITCLRCGRTSWSRDDVLNLYCRACHAFHEPTSANTMPGAAPVRTIADEVEAIRQALAAENAIVEQALGQALGYPWFKDDPKHFPEATAQDGVCVGEHTPASLAAEAAAKIESLMAEVARLRGRLVDTAQDTGQKQGALAEENRRLWKAIQLGDVLIARATYVVGEALGWVEDWEATLDRDDPVHEHIDRWREDAAAFCYEHLITQARRRDVAQEPEQDQHHEHHADHDLDRRRDGKEVIDDVEQQPHQQQDDDQIE